MTVMDTLLALLPALGSVPPFTSLAAPAPALTLKVPPAVGAGNSILQLSLALRASVALVAGVEQLLVVTPAGSVPVN